LLNVQWVATLIFVLLALELDDRDIFAPVSHHVQRSPMI
jgi:hypothetical protein